MSNLKTRISKLEQAGNTDHITAIVIRYEHRVMGKDEKGFDVVVSADYYLNEDRTEPVTREEISELGKEYVCFLPIRRERPQCQVIEN